MDPNVVLKKLVMLREHLGRVRLRRSTTREAFEADVLIQDAVALNFLVAVQEANDIAMHIATAEGWGWPDSYSEGFKLLASNNVISLDHAQEMSSVASVRNRIAHGYGTIDPGRFWAELPAGLDVLDRYAEAIVRFTSDEPA